MSPADTNAQPAPNRHARIVIGVLLAVVLAGALMVVSRQGLHVIGTNGVPLEREVPLEGGQRSCQRSRLVAGADGVQLHVQAYGRPRPRLGLTFVDRSGGVITRGELQGGDGSGLLKVPLDTAVTRSWAGTTACIRNLGRQGVAIGGRKAAAHFRYLTRESWWSRLDSISRSFGYGKATLFGTWTLPAVGLLLTCLWAATIRFLIRETRG